MDRLVTPARWGPHLPVIPDFYVNRPVDCSQPLIFSYHYLIVERADTIAIELDCTIKLETLRGRGWGQ